MLSVLAQPTETATNGSVYHAEEPTVEDPFSPEIDSIYECDPDLPNRIRSNFKRVQEARSALFVQLNSPWSETTEELLNAFDRSVRHHLRMVSEDMYVPVRNRLRVERPGKYERFKIFEDRARKTNELISVFLRKYHRSNQFFNTEFVQDVKTDINRVVDVLTEQLSRERAYLFPVYLTKS